MLCVSIACVCDLSGWRCTPCLAYCRIVGNTGSASAHFLRASAQRERPRRRGKKNSEYVICVPAQSQPLLVFRRGGRRPVDPRLSDLGVLRFSDFLPRVRRRNALADG